MSFVLSDIILPCDNPPCLHPPLSVPSLRRQSLSCTKLLSPHSSGEGEEDKPETRLAMVNREIVRRGALILFCDYVVRFSRMLDNIKYFKGLFTR